MIEKVAEYSKEYRAAISHYVDIITDVARKYVDLNKYYIELCRGTDEDYFVYRLKDIDEDFDVDEHERAREHEEKYYTHSFDVYLHDPFDTRMCRGEYIGRIKYGYNWWDEVDKRTGHHSITLYSDESVRAQADEMFKEWAKEEVKA